MTLAEKKQSTKKGKKIKLLNGNHAAAYAYRHARVGVVSAYPITPQSPLVEKISEFIEKGKMKAKFLMVESEHSAAAACCAASATGSRVGTATSSHGLLLMYELLPWAAGTRLPLVINLATRATGAPWCIWSDHQDFFTVRDVGWIQLFCEDNQEIYDTNLQSFKIAEDPRVYLPIIVAYDGYIISHTMMPVILEDQQDIDTFLPPIRHHINLSDLNHIKGIDPVTTPYIIKREEGTAPGYYEYRYALQKALENSIDIIKEVHEDFSKKFGRAYGNGIYKTFMTEDADTIIFAMGSVASQARNAILKLRKEGLKVGLMSLKLFRPFPIVDLRDFFNNFATIIVFDRDIGYGYEGVLSYELKAALYGLKNPPFIKGFIVGLGGRDINDHQIIEGVKKGLSAAKNRDFSNKTDFIGLNLKQLDI
jgi:pyruvate/2-oxoacid:ferredoxin oxidoreductase alpha subunit